MVLVGVAEIKSRQESVMTSTIQEEVDRNYEAFVKMLPQILPVHRDRFALMKNGEILGYFSTMEDAREAAGMVIKDRLFSIQQVTDAPLGMGFYTNAVVIN
jgi:hypothetical protein